MKTLKFYISTLTFLFMLSFGVSDVAYADSMEAKRHMARGSAAMKMAKSPADYRNAVKEFSLAVKQEPDWANAWFNLGVAQESAEDFQAAMNSFEIYLKKAPGAPDADEVQARIFGLEYIIEQAQAKRMRPAEILNGNWIGQVYLARLNYHFNEDVYRIEGNGKDFNLILVSNNDASFNRQPGKVLFRLTLNDTTISGTYRPEMENPYGCNPSKDYPVQGILKNNGTTIVLNYAIEYAYPWKKSVHAPITGCADHTRDTHQLTITKQ